MKANKIPAVYALELLNNVNIDEVCPVCSITLKELREILKKETRYT